jgi:SpoVK/Ycf46/Vps4 family AAA+-type ATPase
MEDMRANFIFIPVNTVENLVNPSVIPILLSQYREGGNKPLVLIIEDGDATILSRKTHTNSLISTVLNMGDGILGQLLHTRMIISTNVPKTEIDPAVLRAGRLNAYIEVPPVDREQANSIYKRLSGKEFDFKEKTITLADVYGKVNESQNNFKVAKKKQEDTGQYA